MKVVLFCGGERGGDLFCNSDGCTGVERSGAVNPVFKGLALDEFHGVKILAGLQAHAELVHGGDVFVSKCRRRSGFADKTFASVCASLSDVSLNDL